MAKNENAQVSEAIKEINAKDINLNPEPSTVFPFFANDDATGKVLNARQDADLTPAQLARQQFAAEEVQEQGPISRKYEQTKRLFEAGVSEIGDKPVAVFKDIAGGIVEAPRQAVAGALDAVAEIADLIDVDPVVAGAFTMALGGGVTGAKGCGKSCQGC